MTFAERLTRIEKVEKELLKKASSGLQANRNIFPTDMFVLGAIKRVLALAAGFRKLMEVKNFTSAAGLLRMQIDTASRINGLTLVNDPNRLCNAVMAGQRYDKQKDRNGKQLRDALLIEKLAEKFDWVARVYSETSGFIHLSDRHLWASIAKLDDTTQTVHFEISAQDPERPDEDYFEILDCFFEATKMAGLIVMSYLEFRKKLEAART